MLINKKKIHNFENIIFDVCIIGSGPAGISLAHKLSKYKIKVALIPGGGLKISRFNQNFYKGKSNLNVDLSKHRIRVFGGTSKVWGGRCIPLDEIDFQKRSYVNSSGWPIKLKHIEKYYLEAFDYLDIGKKFKKKLFDNFKSKINLIENFKSDLVDSYQIEKFSLPTNFGNKYYDNIKYNKYIHLFDESRFIKFTFKKSNISSVICSCDKKKFTIQSKEFVLAAGGIENTRILLQSNKIIKKNKNLGKYFMTHFSGVIADIHFNRNGDINQKYEIDKEGVYIRRRLQLKKKALDQFKILNFSSFLHHPPIEDPSHNDGILSLMFFLKFIRYVSYRIPPEYSARLINEKGNRKIYIKHIKNIITDFFRILTIFPFFALNRIFSKRKIPSLVFDNPKNIYSLHYHVEHEPYEKNQIKLINEKDFDGNFKVKVNLNATSKDIESIIKSHEIIDNELRKNKLGKIRYRYKNLKKGIVSQVSFGGHQIGTTKMGNKYTNSVVDKNCKVHKIKNLYISSSSIFPTAGQANPVHSIVAFSLRLADHLFFKKKNNLSK